MKTTKGISDVLQLFMMFLPFPTFPHTPSLTLNYRHTPSTPPTHPQRPTLTLNLPHTHPQLPTPTNTTQPSPLSRAWKHHGRAVTSASGKLVEASIVPVLFIAHCRMKRHAQVCVCACVWLKMYLIKGTEYRRMEGSPHLVAQCTVSRGEV